MPEPGTGTLTVGPTFVGVDPVGTALPVGTEGAPGGTCELLGATLAGTLLPLEATVLELPVAVPNAEVSVAPSLSVQLIRQSSAIVGSIRVIVVFVVRLPLS
jgi:hypothetical protein